jgi:hypothetical protein
VRPCIVEGCESPRRVRASGKAEARCADHRNAQARAWYAANPDYHRRQNIRRRGYLSEWQRQHRARNPRLAREASWRANGIPLTVPEYDALLRGQRGRCAICGGRPAPGRRLYVDHAHDETASVRGLLCMGCNAAIGTLGDDVAGLRRALAYLEAAEAA